MKFLIFTFLLGFLGNPAFAIEEPCLDEAREALRTHLLTADPTLQFTGYNYRSVQRNSDGYLYLIKLYYLTPSKKESGVETASNTLDYYVRVKSINSRCQKPKVFKELTE